MSSARGTAKKAKHRVETYNLGTDEYVQVNDSIGFHFRRAERQTQAGIYRRQQGLGRR